MGVIMTGKHGWYCTEATSEREIRLSAQGAADAWQLPQVIHFHVLGDACVDKCESVQPNPASPHRRDKQLQEPRDPARVARMRERVKTKRI